MRVKEESEKSSLTQHSKEKKKKTVASSPWQTDEETMGKVADFIFSGSKIIEDGESSLGIKYK